MKKDSRFVIVGLGLLGGAYALVAGIMLYIAFDELYPSSLSCGTPHLDLWSTLAGVCTVFLTHLFHHH